MDAHAHSSLALKSSMVIIPADRIALLEHASLVVILTGAPISDLVNFFLLGRSGNVLPALVRAAWG